MSEYLSTGTSLNLPRLSVEHGSLERAINDPIVHERLLNAERSAVSALPTSRKYLESVNDTNLQNQCALPAILSVIPDSCSYANVLRQFLLLLIIRTTRGPSHLQMLCPSETHMYCLKTLERQMPRCVLLQC